MIKRIDDIVCPGRYGSPVGPYFCTRCGREIEAGEKYSAVVTRMATIGEIGESVVPGEGEIVCSSCVGSLPVE